MIWPGRFVRSQDLFPTMLILASLPGKDSRFALGQFSRRALRCGGTVTRKNLRIDRYKAAGPNHF